MSELLFEQYEDRLRRRGRVEQTLWNYRVAVSRFKEWLEVEGVSPGDVTPEHIEAWLDSLNYADSTKRLYLTQLRAAYKYAARRGLIQGDPSIEVELPQAPAPVPRVLASAELRRMKERAEGNSLHWTMFHLFAYTGMRRNEARTLTWDGVDLARATMNVVGKGNKRRFIPVHPSLGEVLADLPKRPGVEILQVRGGKAPHPRTMWHWLRELSDEATFHDFRRTVASSLDANGVEEGLIMKIMGWAPKTIFDRHYRNIADSRLQAAILRLYADDPI